MSQNNAEILDQLTVEVEFVGGPGDGKVMELRPHHLQPVVLIRIITANVITEVHAYEWQGEKNKDGRWIYRWARSVGATGMSDAQEPQNFITESSKTA